MRKGSTNKISALELYAPLQLGEVLHRLRKCAKVSQTELGSILGVHQTAVCRIESGDQGLSTEQLKAASDFFKISIDYLVSGRVNYWAVAERFGRVPPVPAKYRALPYSRVRGLLPILLFLNSVKGTTFTQWILSQFEFDSVLFTDPDQPVSVNFELDLLHRIVELGVLSSSNFEDLISQTRQKTVHGTLHSIYESQSTPLRLLQMWILNSHHYETNFLYEIEELSQKHIQLSITPNTHMRKLEYRDSALKDFFCRYKKSYFSEFPKYIGLNPLQIKEQECHFRENHHRCLYTITSR